MRRNNEEAKIHKRCFTLTKTFFLAACLIALSVKIKKKKKKHDMDCKTNQDQKGMDNVAQILFLARVIFSMTHKIFFIRGIHREILSSN